MFYIPIGRFESTMGSHFQNCFSHKGLVMKTEPRIQTAVKWWENSAFAGVVHPQFDITFVFGSWDSDSFEGKLSRNFRQLEQVKHITESVISPGKSNGRYNPVDVSSSARDLWKDHFSFTFALFSRRCHPARHYFSTVSTQCLQSIPSSSKI